MSEAQQILKTPSVSYHQPLETAKQWARSGEDDKKTEAVALLRGLRAKYPHVLAVGHELALALLESNQPEEAGQVLGELEAQFPNLDEETRCRLGRCCKDLGDRSLQAEDLHTAAEYYRRALAKYETAFEVRHGHYPAINRAALLHLLGTLDPKTVQSAAASQWRADAARAARELLDRRDQWPDDNPEDVAVWHRATEAEALLLLQKWEPAAGLYRAAQQSGRLSPQARDSMVRQVERILRGFRNLGITTVGPFQDVEALFPKSPSG
jgi:tetratricopeptide (TPR) repeat protein